MTATLFGIIATIVMGGCTGADTATKPSFSEERVRKTGFTGGIAGIVGCGEPDRAVALAGLGAFLVHGLDADPDNVLRMGDAAAAAGRGGVVSAELWRDTQVLPYADDLVNVLIVGRAGERLPRSELLRVLTPGGRAFIRNDRAWTSIEKAWPREIDDWTHYRYDARGNPASKDTRVGPPRRLRWTDGPLWDRCHETMSGLSAMVSAKGRIFSIFDEGPAASYLLPAKWSLVARDAFNGVVLWRKPIATWWPHVFMYKNGPIALPRRLVAVGEKVYVPLGLDAPLSELDARSGKILGTFKQTSAVEEVLCADGVLLVVSSESIPDLEKIAALEVKVGGRILSHGVPLRTLDQNVRKRIAAIRTNTGKTLWRLDGVKVIPMSLASDGKRVCFHDGDGVVCCDIGSGRKLWRTNVLPLKQRNLPTTVGVNLVLHDEVVLCATGSNPGGRSGGPLVALSLKDGATLWRGKMAGSERHTPPSLMVLDGLVWSKAIWFYRDSGKYIGYDLRTGDVKRQFSPKEAGEFQGTWAHRCYPGKAAGNHIISSRSGVEFVDITTGTRSSDHWARGACLYGILPANGLLYCPPHPCACYIKAKLTGFNALAPKGAAMPESKAPRIERGPAFDRKVIASTAGEAADDWPTYRGNAARSGRSNALIPSQPTRLWEARLPGKPSAPTVAAGKVFLSLTDRNAVIALDAGRGEQEWTFSTGGRVDSPPTIAAGRAYFGCGDGYVYCVDAARGKLIWRFRAAPHQRRIAAFGRIESPWPVHGSVLVRRGVVFCSAGRSSFLDGGIRILRLSAARGELLSEETVCHLDDERTNYPKITGLEDDSMEGLLSDIMSSTDESVFMRHLQIGLDGKVRTQRAKHLFAPAGFLDDNWHHRTYWTYADNTWSGPGAHLTTGWYGAANRNPSGRILVFDREQVYGFGRKFYPGMVIRPFSWNEGYHLFAAAKEQSTKPFPIENLHAAKANRYDWSKANAVKFTWSKPSAVEARAMVLARSKVAAGVRGVLFIAGPVGDTIRSADAFAGRLGLRLVAVDAADGKTIATVPLKNMPVFDGMAAAAGRLFISTRNNTIVCLGQDGKGKAPGQ